MCQTHSSEVGGHRKNIDFDDLLPYIGEFGLYQKILFILMIPYAFFMAWVYFTQMFITLVPEEHWCKVPELSSLAVEQRIELAIPSDFDEDHNVVRSKCLMYEVNFTDLVDHGLTVANRSWRVQKCQHGWEFNFTEIPYPTIATELEWVCENATLPSTAQSIFFVGAIFGGLIFGWIADKYGRIPALVGTNVAGFLAGIATAYTRTFWQFCVCRFLVGLAFDNCFTIMYILVLEYVGPKWRTFVGNMSIAMFFTFAGCVLPWIAFYLADWRLTCLVTSAPLAIAIATPWLVPESARWLVCRGRVEEALVILKKFERINGTKVPDGVYKEFAGTCSRDHERRGANETYSVLDLFKTPRLRRITLLLITIWMAISLCFDGHIRNVGSLGLNVFITFTIATFTEFPADLLLIALLDRWGRRWLACLSMVLCGIFSLCACAVPTGIYSAILAIAGRFCVNISYNIGMQYAAELLPTVVRGQGVAFIHIMGYVASILSPFVVYMVVLSPILPLLVLGILGIFGGGLTLFLPESLGLDLPQTLEDGEDFGKSQGMWHMPCLSRNTTTEERQCK